MTAAITASRQIGVVESRGISSIFRGRQVEKLEPHLLAASYKRKEIIWKTAAVVSAIIITAITAVAFVFSALTLPVSLSLLAIIAVTVGVGILSVAGNRIVSYFWDKGVACADKGEIHARAAKFLDTVLPKTSPEEMQQGALDGFPDFPKECLEKNKWPTSRLPLAYYLAQYKELEGDVKAFAHSLYKLSSLEKKIVEKQQALKTCLPKDLANAMQELNELQMERQTRLGYKAALYCSMHHSYIKVAQRRVALQGETPPSVKLLEALTPDKDAIAVVGGHIILLEDAKDSYPSLEKEENGSLKREEDGSLVLSSNWKNIMQEAILHYANVLRVREG